MAATLKTVFGDVTNKLPPPAAKPPRPAADEPRRVVTWYHSTELPPPRTAELLRPAPPAAPPKESSSAFVFFGRATRDDIKAAHPDWSLGDVGRELGKRWKALDDAAKKPFLDLAAADKERYEREKAAYDAANPPAPVVAENVPSNEAPPPRVAKRKKPPTKEVPIDEDQDWTPKNDGKQLVSVWTGKPVKPPRAKKQKKEPAAKPAAKPAKKLAAPPATKTRVAKKKNPAAANYGRDSRDRPNPNVGRAWGKSAGEKAPKYIECYEGAPYNPGPAVPGAKAWPASKVPQECLGYPDYKEGHGKKKFRKGKDASSFYKDNGYHKIPVNNGHHPNSKQAVFKFFKEVARA